MYAEEWELRNTSGARIIRTVTHSEARSLGAEVSAELSVNMGQLIAEANAKISAKISASASYTTTTQETVEVPAFTSLVYRRGVGHRKITVSESQVHRDCSQTELKTVTLKGATNLSVARPL